MAGSYHDALRKPPQALQDYKPDPRLVFASCGLVCPETISRAYDGNKDVQHADTPIQSPAGTTAAR